MARGVRFTKPEREVIRNAFGLAGFSLTDKQRKVANSVLDKLEAAEAPKEARGAVTLAEATAAFQAELGSRLTLPPSPDQTWYIVQQKRLKQLGLTNDHCTTIAREAGAQWQGRIKLASLINQAESLLADAAERGRQTETAPQADSLLPNLIGDDDLDEL